MAYEWELRIGCEYADGGGSVDMQAPVPEELRLMQEPVQAMRARLLAILEEHPDNAILLAPLAVCDRLLGAFSALR
jgi:hypothetical protein